MCLSVWAIQKLSKPQHARQMHEMFGCQMTPVIFVALWFMPVLRHDNSGFFFEDFRAIQFGHFGIFLPSDLHFAFCLFDL